MSYKHYLRIHQVLEHLDVHRDPNDLKESQIPPKGIYIHYEADEGFTDHEGFFHERIVRIGIGTEEPTGLRRRLLNHYDFKSMNSLTSFQAMIYRALKQRKRPGILDRMSEGNKRKQLQDYMCNNLWFKVIGSNDVDDIESWEKALLATLSPYSFRLSSPEWLGKKHFWKGTTNSYEPGNQPSIVPDYGLWNEVLTTAYHNEFDDNDLAIFEQSVRQSQETYGRPRLSGSN